MTNLPITGAFSVTAIYGQKGSLWANGHKGVDIVSGDKTIYSPCDGTVRVVAYDAGGWGQYVSIGDSEGRRHILCHMVKGSVKVQVGQKVDRLTVIGTMGATGNVTGLHLHYQINDSGNTPVNPCPYMGIPNKQGNYRSEDFEIKEGKEMYKDDAQISGWAKDAVEKCQKAGILLGDDEGKFRPKDAITREEFAVALARALKL